MVSGGKYGKCEVLKGTTVGIKSYAGMQVLLHGTLKTERS